MAKTELRNEAINLRLKERLSLEAISKQLGVAQSSCSMWLRDYPLTEVEVKERNAKHKSGPPKKFRGDKSKFFEVVEGRELSRSHKARIAESAILFRLALYDLTPYGSPFDGDKTDWLVENKQGKTMKVQVRWARTMEKGLPILSLRCSDGRHATRRYGDDEFDFIVAYDLFSDTAYVFNPLDVKGIKNIAAVKPEFAEAWQQIVDFAPVTQR